LWDGATAAPAVAVAAPATVAAAPAPAVVASSGFDFAPINAAVERATAAAASLGGEALEAAKALSEGFKAQAAFVAQAGKQKKPEGDALAAMLAPTSAQIVAASDIADRRKNDFPLHSKMANEIAQGFAWVLDTEEPAKVVTEALGSAMFHGNRILSANKDDATQKAFVTELQAAMKELIAQVKANAPRGLLWDGAAAVAAPAAVPVAAAPSAAAAASAPSAVTSLDGALKHIAAAAAAAATIGTEAQEGVAALQAAVAGVVAFIAASATQAKPEMAQLQAMLEPITKHMGAINEIADRRKNALPLHSKMLNEVAQGLAWVMDTEEPAKVVTEALGSAMFHGNRILSANKDDATQKSFVTELQAATKQMIAYVQSQFPKGLIWGKGAAPSSAPATATATAAAAPAPQSALFAELAKKAESVASGGLRHVTDDQKTHKQVNREVRMVDTADLKPKKRSKASWMPAAGPEKIELVGMAWQVQCVRSSETPLDDLQPRVVVLDQVERRHAVIITRCVNVVVRITSKVNAVTIIDCLNVKVEIADTISAVSVSGSQELLIWILGACPSVALSKTHSTIVSLRSQTDTEFFTNCTSSISVALPVVDAETGETDMKEYPLPEQYEARLVGNTVKTVPVEHMGG
jgi:adenylyl cyclase-associated protein